MARPRQALMTPNTTTHRRPKPPPASRDNPQDEQQNHVHVEADRWVADSPTAIGVLVIVSPMECCGQHEKEQCRETSNYECRFVHDAPRESPEVFPNSLVAVGGQMRAIGLGQRAENCSDTKPARCVPGLAVVLRAQQERGYHGSDEKPLEGASTEKFAAGPVVQSHGSELRGWASPSACLRSATPKCAAVPSRPA